MAAFLIVNTLEALTYKVALLRPRYLERQALAAEVRALILRYLLG